MNSLFIPSQAEQIIRNSIKALEYERLPFRETLGRTLQEDLYADRPFPPFDRVTMDGIACRFSDLEFGPLIIQGLHPAGSPAPPETLQHHCWQVMTGAVMPPDCDTVIPIEELHLSEKRVSLSSDSQPCAGRFIHREGSDCTKGTLLLTSGSILTASGLGLAATIGATQLAVNKLPRIAIFSTGDELVQPDQTPFIHQLRQSNGPSLWSQCQADTRSETITLQHLPDDLEQIKKALQPAMQENDLVLLSGGISEGVKDLIRPALQSLIGEPTFHGIAQRPGKPLAYWSPTLKSPPVFALPGNPNSTLTTYFRYVRPALHLLAGSEIPEPVTLPLSNTLTAHPKLTLFLPAHLQVNGTLQVRTPQNSGDFTATLSASGFIEVPAGTTPVSAAAYRAY